MYSKLILGYRMGKIQRRYAHLGYEVRHRLIATAYAKLVKPKWVSELYTPSIGASININTRFNDPVSLVDSITRLIDIVHNREDVPAADKITTTFKMTLDDWLVDKKGHRVLPGVLVERLITLVPKLSTEITSCKLANEERLEYYQQQTVAHMEDASMFFNTVLELKLSK